MAVTAPDGSKKSGLSVGEAERAALALIPPDEVADDDEVLAPEATEDVGTVADPTVAAPKPAAAVTAPSADSQPAAAAPTADAQPMAPASLPAAATGSTVTDPWAETEDVTYVDADTGEEFTVRAPKAYAPKVKDGYARRSVMDRNNRYLKQNRSWLEPIIERGGFDSLRPIIERGTTDRAFAEGVTELFRRANAGLPLFDAPPAQPGTAAPSAAAAVLGGPGAAAPAPAADVNDYLKSIDEDPDIDDYTKSVLKRAISPLAAKIEAQAQAESARQAELRTTAERDQSRAAAEQAQREFGLRMRRELQARFPAQFTEQTPAAEYIKVYEYAKNAGLFQTYGRTPATILLAKQAMDNPMGLDGVFAPAGTVAPSAAAAGVAAAAAEGERLAAEAARAVGRATAPNGSVAASPASADVGGAKAKPRVPRYVVDARGNKRPLTPNEIAGIIAPKER